MKKGRIFFGCPDDKGDIEESLRRLRGGFVVWHFTGAGLGLLS